MPTPADPSRRVTPDLDAKTAQQLRSDLVAFLTHRTRDATLAEDLAQQAFVHVLANLPRLRGAAALRTWARRIAANVWRDHLRRQAASPAARAARGDPVSVTALLDALGPSAPPSVERALDRRATHDCLLDAVRTLPVDARRILLLHDFGEMPLEEVAVALGCSVGSAKVRLHRARRRLAECCRAECIGEAVADGTVSCTPKRGAPRSLKSRRRS